MLASNVGTGVVTTTLSLIDAFVTTGNVGGSEVLASNVGTGVVTTAL